MVEGCFAAPSAWESGGQGEWVEMVRRVAVGADFAAPSAWKSRPSVSRTAGNVHRHEVLVGIPLRWRRQYERRRKRHAYGYEARCCPNRHATSVSALTHSSKNHETKEGLTLFQISQRTRAALHSSCRKQCSKRKSCGRSLEGRWGSGESGAEEELQSQTS